MPRTKSKRPCRRQRELQPHATPVPAVGCRDNALILVEILRPFQAIISVMNVEGSLRQSACSERVSRPSPQALPRCAHACARPFTRHLPAGLLAVAGDQAIAGRQTALAEMTSQRKRCHQLRLNRHDQRCPCRWTLMPPCGWSRNFLATVVTCPVAWRQACAGSC